MGVDAAADFENSGTTGIAITNFDAEMMALYKLGRGGVYTDVAMASGVGRVSRNRLGFFGCAFLDIDLDGWLDLPGGCERPYDDTVRSIAGNHGYAQAPHLFPQRRTRRLP